MQPRADAATSRAESDWLVGINATRALTSFNSRSGGFQKTAAGRVQTPTLAILAGREEKIRSFKPRPYFEVHADLGVKAGSYRGRWFDERFKSDGDEDARAERLWSREKAAAIEAKCANKTGEITEEKKSATQASPLLYDLTTLQREANGRFSLSARRTLSVFYPAAQFEVTTRITRVEGEPFKTDGRIIVDPGWKAVYGKEAAGEDEQSIVPISPNERANVLAIEIKENETKPPARFNEATLLSAMEGAGKLVEDEELREAMSERGLGTPATRAQIIEGLIFDGYVERKGKELIVTAKGLSLITLLRNLHTDVLCTPELTGEWEFRLKQMAHGKLDRRHFMEDIRGLTREIVEKVRK